MHTCAVHVNLLKLLVLIVVFFSIISQFSKAPSWGVNGSYLTWAESSSELFWSPVVRRLSVHPSVRPSVCLSVCKLFTFSSSSPEPLGQFQPNLAQSILGWRGFKFVQMKGRALFQGEIITKQWKYIDEIKKSSSSEPLGQFQPNVAQSIFGWRGFISVQINGPALFQGKIIRK